MTTLFIAGFFVLVAVTRWARIIHIIVTTPDPIEDEK